MDQATQIAFPNYENKKGRCILIANETTSHQNLNEVDCFCIFRFEEDQYDKVPQFIFGDFNFRLDSNTLINVSMDINRHDT